MIELKSSMYATIDRQHETYICIHDIVEFVACKLGTGKDNVKWKHADQQTFLITMPDTATRDKFILSNKCAVFGDAIVTFKPWVQFISKAPNPCRYKDFSSVQYVTRTSDPCLLKVWLKLKGLPIEHLCFNTAELIVAGFGRLHRCNMEKKKLMLVHSM